MKIRHSACRGAALMMVLVLIGMISVTLLLATKQALQLFQQQRREADARQAQWLAEGAAERGLAALAQDPAYQGETWNVTVPVSPTATAAGVAEIRISRGEDSNLPPRLIVTALFPNDSHHGVKQVIDIILPPAKKVLP